MRYNKNKIDTNFLKDLLGSDSFNALVDAQVILLKRKKSK